MTLSIKALSKWTGGNVLYRDVSFECEPGGCVSLIGQSGSGKTSLLKGISGIATPDAGSVRLHGIAVVGTESHSTQRERPYPSITMVFQQFPLFPHLTVGAHVALLKKTTSPGDGPVIDDVWERLGIDGMDERKPRSLSVGQRQRVAIALAISQRPEYLLLDEPTSAQDIVNVSALAELLVNLRQEGCGIVLATHLLGFARTVGTAFCFLDGGVVREAGHIITLNAPKSQELRDFVRFAGA
jgi:polar amino acid transport system ATP-binding protein